MGRRNDRKRKEARKARNREWEATHWVNLDNPETRDSRYRWTGLRARGGMVLNFDPTGHRIPVDLDAPGAEFSLAARGVRAPEGEH